MSILLRAPAAAFAQLGSDDVVLQYRLGVFACLLATGVLALWLAHNAARRGTHPLICAAFAFGLMVNPVTFRAIDLGHPEEPLAALLTVTGIVAAANGRALAAGVVLGLAIATKQWALLALGPMLLVTPSALRRKATAVTIIVAAVAFLPVVVGNPTRFRAAQKEAAGPTANATPTNIWWTFDRQLPVGDNNAAFRRLPTPAVKAVAHWIVVLFAFGASYAVARRNRHPGLATALVLAALIFLLRCVLDPYTFSYHHWPFLAALASYEVVAKRRFPFLAVIAGACLWYLSYHVSGSHLGNPLFHSYIAWTLPMTALLAYVTVRELNAASRVASTRSA